MAKQPRGKKRVKTAQRSGVHKSKAAMMRHAAAQARYRQRMSDKKETEVSVILPTKYVPKIRKLTSRLRSWDSPSRAVTTTFETELRDLLIPAERRRLLRRRVRRRR
jgi:hypothetical protein